MTALVNAVIATVPDACQAKRCSKVGCWVSLQGAPAARVILDLDCEELRIGDRKHCDYVLIGVESGHDWVVPMELKGGRFKVQDVVKQLDGGAAVVSDWIPTGCAVDLVPVLVHGKGLHRHERDRLRSARVRLRNQTRRIELVRCGQPLADALRGT